MSNIKENYQMTISKRKDIGRFLDRLADEALFIQSQVSKLLYASEISVEVGKKIIEEETTTIAEIRRIFKPELEEVLRIRLE